MGRNPSTNVYLAPKKNLKSLAPLGRLLAFIGKSVYFILSRAILALLFIIYITGYFTRVTLTNFFKFLLRLSILTFINLPKALGGFLKKQGPRVEKLKKSARRLLGLPAKFLAWLKRTRAKLAIAALALFIIAVAPAAYLFWNLIIKDLPSPGELTARNLEESTKIYDRNGVLLYKIYENQNRTPVSLSRIPDYVKAATLAIEDAEFYSHPGFSIRGIMRAAVRMLEKKEISGGSTITQQLVKNALLSPEKTLTRKFKEFVLAIQVEQAYSKDEILEMYLNEVSYGGTAYGIQEAARMYFDKDVNKLTLGEAALLAGLPKSPTQYSPFGPNPSLAFEREKEVLHLMKVNGYIKEEQEKEALSEKITFAANKIEIKAPHFVMYVRSALEEEYGKEVVEKGGLEVITSLDYQIQKLAERVISEEIEKLSPLNVGNGAAVVLNPETGEILAMVGSKDYFDTAQDGNVNVTTSLRQPGSSIKVVNYAYALSHGYTPATIIADTPITFLVQGQPPYTPKNYEGGFRGNLPLRSAFAESRNVAAVKVLASYGVGNMMDMGKSLGITTWENPENYGLSLTLGGGEVKLIELARVYAVVANYGKRPEITSILKVSNNKGGVLEENHCIKIKPPMVASSQELGLNVYASESGQAVQETNRQSCLGQEVLDARVAYLITDILRDNSARTPAFGPNSALVIPGRSEVAVKTGTSNDLRDNLTVGFNQKYLVAVWVGNNDNSPMARIASGITGAAPIFNKIMSALLASEENQEWKVPEGLVQVPICSLTGTLTCQGCPTKTEWFLQETVPITSCNPDYIKTLTGKETEGEILEPAAHTEN